MDEKRLYNDSENSGVRGDISEPSSSVSESGSAVESCDSADENKGAGDAAINESSVGTKRQSRSGAGRSDKSAEDKAKGHRGKELRADTDRDRLICNVASCVALAAAVAFAVFLGSSVGSMADMLEGLEAAARVMAAIANLMLTFGLGIGALVLCAIAFVFAKRAYTGAVGKRKTLAQALMLLPGAVAFAVLIMLAVSVFLVI